MAVRSRFGMEKVCILMPAQEQKQALAQWDLQKRLAAGSITDELLMPNTAFLSPAQDGLKDSQVSQAQKMASFLEAISGGGLSVSISYDPIVSPTASNSCLLSSPGLLPQTLVENQLADTIYPTVNKNTVDYEKKPCNGTPGPMAFRLFPACKAPRLILAVRNSISAVRFFC